MSKMNSSNQHVLPHSGGWAVRKSGASKNTKVFSSQSAAVGYARKVAKSGSCELFIHSKDGRIRERNSYGTDLHPPRG